MAKRKRVRPFIGPCRDPLDLWFLEVETGGQVFRRYFMDQAEARAALDAMRKTILTPSQDRMLKAIDGRAGADGWADWTDVYNAWDPKNVPPQFAGRSAQLTWKNLEGRGLVEGGDGGRVRRKPAEGNR